MPNEMEGTGPTPEGPKAPKIAPAILERYFKSIEDPFRKTQAGLAAGSPIGWFVAGFIFCLIPLIPYALSKLAFRIVGMKVVSFRSLHFHIASFWFWWVVSFVVSLLLLIMVSKWSGASPDEKKKWLSPAQMRFAYCYGVVREVQEYKTNQRGAHIDEALTFLDKTATSLIRWSSLDVADVYPDQYRRLDIPVSRELGTALGPVLFSTHPKWYRLRPETEAILTAFREFVPKLRDRLKDRKDLASIEAALTDLAAYEYTEIPELSESKSETRFEEGTELLLSFAAQVIALPPYRSEPLTPTPKEKLSRKLFVVGSKLSALFTHESVLVALSAWLVFMLLLFWGGFYVALKLFPIKVDSTIIAALIGGPVATAVTGATIPRLGKAKKTQS